MDKIGFIGMGNMAMAMVNGFVKSNAIKSENILGFAPNQEKLKMNAERLGFLPCKTLEALINESQVIIMACKPNQVESILAEIKGHIEDRILVSVVNGWDYKRYEERLGSAAQIQCIMPNTPASVTEGVFIFEQDNSLTSSKRLWLEELLSQMGTVIEMPATLMSAGAAICGCSPAFIDMMMEAMADAAVLQGIPREEAYRMVAQTVIGAGKLMLESGKHPGELKDAVCSPGGTTIRGVEALEHAGMRAAFMDAINAAAGK